jgi:Ca2+:H+ antiporter
MTQPESPHSRSPPGHTSKDNDGNGKSAFGRSQWIATGLLLAVPVAPILKYIVGASPVWIFAAGAVAIAVLADWIRRATEQAAKSLGPAIGGLMTVSFGSIAEIVLALFVLAEGNAAVVKAQITGSILGTSLLGLGLAIVVGTLGREQLRFKRERASLLASLLILVVIALLLPAAFDLAQRTLSGAPRMIDEVDLSLGVSIVLLALYAANLAYTLITHRDVFASDEPRESEGAWPMGVSVGVLIGATVLVAMEAEAVSAALEATAASLGLSDIFVGVIVLALIGTASDLVAAVWFAKRGKVGLALSICVGSSIQVGLVVAPLLVIASWVLGNPITLVFANPLDLFAIAGTAFIVNAIASDGEATWFEGVLLIGVYVLLGMAFFFVDRPA